MGSWEGWQGREGREGNQGLPCCHVLLAPLHSTPLNWFWHFPIPCQPEPLPAWLLLISFCLQTEGTRATSSSPSLSSYLGQMFRVSLTGFTRSPVAEPSISRTYPRDPPRLLHFAIMSQVLEVVHKERDQFALFDEKLRTPISLIFLRVSGTLSLICTFLFSSTTPREVQISF
jgi:hypothetical protein